MEEWLPAAKNKYPGDNTDGNHMVVIVLANRIHQGVDPRLSHLLSRATSQIESEPLYEELATQFTGQPIRSRLRTWQNRLVHQVVAKNCRAVLTNAGHRFPEGR